MVTGKIVDAGELPLDDQAFAEALRPAAIRLAVLALAAADGDPDAAKAMLRGPLEAIGALPYEPGRGKYRWGQAG